MEHGTIEPDGMIGRLKRRIACRSPRTGPEAYIKSYKNRFPFSLGTTSFILPVKEDSLAANVRFLKDSFDFVQLLFFGRNYLDEVMSPRIIGTLKALREETGLRYTIHLPADLELLSPSEDSMNDSIGVIERIMAETERLDIDGYVLHVDALEHGSPRVELSRDQLLLFQRSLEAMAGRIGQAAGNILIENTSYDLTYFSGIIMRSPCQICMDAGHFVLHHHDAGRYIELFNSRIRQVHLHGVSGGRDHRALADLDTLSGRSVSLFLKKFAGPVIIEVYNLNDLIKSAEFLERNFGI
jgi:sugar phosphate isomerase/epimerase